METQISLLSPDEIIRGLVENFRSLLDETLILSIAQDYDLTTHTAYELLKNTLAGLAEDVPTEEATGFNPSGIAEGPEQVTDGASTSEASTSQNPSRTNESDTTTSDLASQSSGSLYDMPELHKFDEESEETKVLSLKSMFGDLKEHDVNFCLRNAGGDFQTALDELLNIQYLRSTGQEKKGIDTFFDSEGDTQPGKKKKRNRNRKKSKKPVHADDLSSPTEATSSNALKEMKHQNEISYLADRLDLPFNEVSAIYSRKRCASGATAVEILDQHISLGITAYDDASKQRARELADKYHNVPAHYMATVVQVTGSIPQWSDDIAALLGRHFAKHPWSKKLAVDYTLAPLPREELEGSEVASSSRNKAGAGRTAPKPPADLASYTQANDRAHQHGQARREATSSAATYSRRGAGGRQVAGFYAEEAREHGRRERQALSDAADALVDSRSSANEVDLHHVYVSDGVRIARDRTEGWWRGLGDFRRGERARQQPLKIITGQGNHNRNGVSPLRQAVIRALLEDGWDLSIKTGYFDVKGRR